MNNKFLAIVGVSALALTSAANAATLNFGYTGTIESWVAGTTGTYRITATGAQGAAGDPDYVGGRGAQIAGDFELIAGMTYYIAVGGAGTANYPGVDSGSGGGGGGTFFVSSTDDPLLIAGGGGGTRARVDQNGTDASITTAAYNASGGGTTYTPLLKTTGIGQGGIASSSSWGSAGAGFYSDGAGDGSYGTGGSSWLNGLAGGVALSGCSYPSATGGFGGGGAGNGCSGGGGGGGYSGGDGGRVAGGGGSFNAGLDVFALAGVGYGNGSLTIEWDDTLAAVPLPATLPLLLSGVFGGIVFGRRKKKSI